MSGCLSSVLHAEAEDRWCKNSTRVVLFDCSVQYYYRSISRILRNFIMYCKIYVHAEHINTLMA